jgi:hypothetical protein
VRSLLAAGLERVLVVVGHDAGPVATIVGRLGRDRVRVVYTDRWADGNGASLAGVQEESWARRYSSWSRPTTSSERAGWIGCWRPVSRPCSSIPHRCAGPGGGTQVRFVDQAVVAFGTHLDEPAIDCGAFLLPPRCSNASARRPPKVTTPWPVP